MAEVVKKYKSVDGYFRVWDDGEVEKIAEKTYNKEDAVETIPGPGEIVAKPFTIKPTSKIYE